MPQIPKMPGKRTMVRPSNKRISRGGIIMPNNVCGESALEGTIIAVGPDCEMAKVGDLISFAPYSKYSVPKEEGEYKNHLLINEEDILCFWVEKEEPKASRSIKCNSCENSFFVSSLGMTPPSGWSCDGSDNKLTWRCCDCNEKNRIKEKPKNARTTKTG